MNSQEIRDYKVALYEEIRIQSERAKQKTAQDQSTLIEDRKIKMYLREIEELNAADFQ